MKGSTGSKVLLVRSAEVDLETVDLLASRLRAIFDDVRLLGKILPVDPLAFDRFREQYSTKML